MITGNMRKLITFWCLFITAIASAENDKMTELKLKNGKIYTTVTITKKTADGVTIMHESGTACVPFEQLPDELVKTLGGFDAAAAKAERERKNAQEAATLAEIEKGVAAQAGADAAKNERGEE